MPKAGLDTATVVAAAAALADEIGFDELTMARLAERLGVRSPSLYKHVLNQGDLNRQVAALALEEAGAAMGVAIQGHAGRAALAAAARALRDFVLTHPGRYAAATNATSSSPDEQIVLAAIRSLHPFEAVLRGYDIAPEEMTHALRSLRSAFHGFASLQVGGGFQWAADSDTSFEWLIDLIDRGLRTRARDQAENAGAACPTGVHLEGDRTSDTWS